MKQSKLWVMAALGVLVLGACGTTPKATKLTTTTGTVDSNTGGGGTGDGGTKPVVTPPVVSRIPAGPTGPLTKNVDFKVSKADANTIRGIIDGVAQGDGPASVIGGLAAIGKAVGGELNVGTQSCDAGGTFTSNSTGGDADGDGIPGTAKVTFNNCAYTFQGGKVVLNGKLELEDHNNSDDDNSFLFAASLDVTGQGSVSLGDTVIDINKSAKLDLGLDIMNNGSSYDIALGANLVVDGKTLAARFDANIKPKNAGNYGSGGTINLNGKIGISEPGSDTVLGLSTTGLTYGDSDCGLKLGAITLTDGLHNLVITQNNCDSIDAKLDGNFYDI
jgi:hypothetical protein